MNSINTNNNNAINDSSIIDHTANSSINHVTSICTSLINIDITTNSNNINNSPNKKMQYHCSISIPLIIPFIVITILPITQLLEIVRSFSDISITSNDINNAINTVVRICTISHY